MPRPSRFAPGGLPRPPHWSDDAACRDSRDEAVFFPEDFGVGLAHIIAAEAKAYCGRCPVREACLAAALERREPAGVWGGLDSDERRAIRRRQQRRARRRKEGAHAAPEAADAA
ncbi:WhiB family transcriptional regulator [Streptomyces sp. NPDC001027]|uniref:WhiB family transcriptional regulator n=1 Tax=Streptomyces sp. NPDC001027 TaxID=3154771 RepID=UPI003320CABD